MPNPEREKGLAHQTISKNIFPGIFLFGSSGYTRFTYELDQERLNSTQIKKLQEGKIPTDLPYHATRLRVKTKEQKEAFTKDITQKRDLLKKYAECNEPAANPSRLDFAKPSQIFQLFRDIAEDSSPFPLAVYKNHLVEFFEEDGVAIAKFYLLRAIDADYIYVFYDMKRELLIEDLPYEQWCKILKDKSEVYGAIEWYEGSSLCNRIKKDYPKDWAKTKAILAKVYRNLRTPKREEGLGKAIDCYEEALRIFTKEDSPDQWAEAQHSLGRVYYSLGTGDREENLRRAIRCFDAALSIRTKKTYREEWARIQHNLGNAYSLLSIVNGRTENIDLAFGCYESALSVRTKAAFPSKWAITWSNMGNLYQHLSRGSDKELLMRVKEHSLASLEILTEEDYPDQWAKINDNMGMFYLLLSQLEDRQKNLNSAYDYHKASLRVYTQSDYPEEWAKTNYNLGCVFRELSQIENKKKHLDQAIGYFRKSLLVYTVTDFPNEWAMTQYALKCVETPKEDNGTPLTQSVDIGSPWVHKIRDGIHPLSPIKLMDKTSSLQLLDDELRLAAFNRVCEMSPGEIARIDPKKVAKGCVAFRKAAALQRGSNMVEVPDFDTAFLLLNAVELADIPTEKLDRLQQEISEARFLKIYQAVIAMGAGDVLTVDKVNSYLRGLVGVDTNDDQKVVTVNALERFRKELGTDFIFKKNGKYVPCEIGTHFRKVRGRRCYVVYELDESGKRVGTKPLTQPQTFPADFELTDTHSPTHSLNLDH